VRHTPPSAAIVSALSTGPHEALDLTCGKVGNAASGKGLALHVGHLG
jgi:hypothetical protein